MIAKASEDGMDWGCSRLFEQIGERGGWEWTRQSREAGPYLATWVHVCMGGAGGCQEEDQGERSGPGLMHRRIPG